jgi:hypothetical protein
MKYTGGGVRMTLTPRAGVALAGAVGGAANHQEVRVVEGTGAGDRTPVVRVDSGGEPRAA